MPTTKRKSLKVLVKARKQYEADVKAVVDPITTAYLKKLDKMLKDFGGKGDLESCRPFAAKSTAYCIRLARN